MKIMITCILKETVRNQQPYPILSMKERVIEKKKKQLQKKKELRFVILQRLNTKSHSDSSSIVSDYSVNILMNFRFEQLTFSSVTQL